MTVPGPDASAADKIKWILQGYEDPTKFITDDEETETDTDKLQQDVAKVAIKDNEVDYEEQIQRDFLSLDRPGGLLNQKKKDTEEKKTTDDKQDASTSS
jgi:hypothetical protein